MPPALTTTSHAVLGLLATRRWTTYELALQIDRSLGWFWPRTSRKIYDEAKRLVAYGYAQATEEPVGRRPRTVYEITDAGRSALRGWLGEPSAPPKFESEAMVRAFFAEAGDLADLRATMTHLRDHARERRQVLTAMKASVEEGDYLFPGRRHLNVLQARYQIDHHRLLEQWASWVLDTVAEWPSTADPGPWSWTEALDAPYPGVD